MRGSTHQLQPNGRCEGLECSLCSLVSFLVGAGGGVFGQEFRGFVLAKVFFQTLSKRIILLDRFVGDALEDPDDPGIELFCDGFEGGVHDCLQSIAESGFA